MNDYSFQGKINLGTRRTGGLPGALFWVGDAPKCEVSLKTETSDRTESYSGKRLQSARMVKTTKAEISLTLNWMDAKTLGLGLYATTVSRVAGTVTGEQFPATVAVGDVIVLAKGGASSVVLTDSTGTPVSLVAGTHYTADPNNAGLITIKSLTGLTQPIKAAYSYSAAQVAPLFTATAPERYLFLDGINTVTGEKVNMHLYRVQFDPADNISLINEDFGQMTLKGAVLYDSEAANDPELGGFGKIELPQAA
ncbi:MAG: hypothetical protein JSR63_07815 [Proteobacteria bacterium]|nr:hypothetical protein [Pseudomonadota bacterium]